MARMLNSVKIEFIPTGLKTKNDPLGQRGYLTWKAAIADQDRSRHYGDVTELSGMNDMITEATMAEFTSSMVEKITSILNMTAAEIEQADADVLARYQWNASAMQKEPA